MFPASDLLFDFGYLNHEGGDRLKGLEGLEGLLEGIPNRDSLPYASMYGLDSPKPTQTLRTLLRGTLRYKGFSALMQRFRKQGFLDRQSRVRVDDLMMMMSDFEGSKDVDADADADDTVGGGGVLEGKKERERIWKEVVRRIRSDNRYESGNRNGNGWNGKNREEEEEDPLDRPLAWLLSADTGTPPLSHSNSTWIGLPPLPLPPPLTSNPSNPSNPSKPPNPQTHMSPIDLFTALLSHKLQYGSGERDMVVLVHEVVTRDVGVSVSVSEGVEEGEGVEVEEGVEEEEDGVVYKHIEEQIHTSSLVIFGSHHPTHLRNDPVEYEYEYGYESAMARSVGIPVAVAALAVLDGVVDPLVRKAPVSLFIQLSHPGASIVH
ncbi:hypothetical protein FB446DRAFT_715586 [Lentinula raphanica]|nr:hypothetical protein FB446DRAFT_715586 [Lentinula raphanica]